MEHLVISVAFGYISSLHGVVFFGVACAAVFFLHWFFYFVGRHRSRIFIVMLHLYGTRGDTKIWAKTISAHAKKCSGMEVSVAEGRRVGQKRGLFSDLSGHERKTGRLQVWRSNKYSAQYLWVLPWSREKRVNLCIARGRFGAIISMKIVVEFSLLCCSSMAHAEILRCGRK